MTDIIGQRCALLSPTRDGHGVSEWRELVGRWEYERGRPYYELEGGSDISQVRSELASIWLEVDDTEWSVWLDDDMVVSLPALEEFVSLGIESGNDLVAATYVGKKPRSGHIATLFARDDVILGAGGGYEPILGTGFGCVMVRRSVFERLMLSLPRVRYERSQTLGYPYFLGMVLPAPGDEAGVGRHAGEDFAFCHRVASVGASLVADTRFRVGHRGPYTYYWEDVDDEVKRRDRIEVHRVREVRRCGNCHWRHSSSEGPDVCGAHGGVRVELDHEACATYQPRK
jgi:hypothetical protein